MAEIELLIRTENRLTEAARLAGQDETGPLSNHIGDIIEIRQSGHLHSDIELKTFAIIRISDFPDKDPDAIKSILEPMYAVPASKGSNEKSVSLVASRISKIDTSALVAAAPGLSAKIANTFDNSIKIGLNDIPVMDWATLGSSLVSR